ncbi:MAG: hypothetical protein LIO59_03320, partial [Oscillospiraceae bacterium]|nr:hypothetical protein [Oscillospiraceae bacterium]
AAMLASSAVAFAATDYDDAMWKAQTLFGEGMYYEAEAILVDLQASELTLAQTVEVDKWYNATRYQIEILEQPQYDDWQKLEGFNKVAEYLNDGLYYEAEELLYTIANVYNLTTVEQAKWIQYLDLAEAGIQWWEAECNEGATAEGAVAAVKSYLINAGEIDADDDDIAYDVDRTYSTSLEDGYNVTVYSKLARSEGKTGTLAIYFVADDGSILPVLGF